MVKRELRERIEDQAARRRLQVRAKDPEAAFDELVDALADVVPEEPLSPDEFLHEDEFVCRDCRMIQHRSRLADPLHVVCISCSTVGARGHRG